MKLQRLRVEELRQFRQPYELADLQPGLNIFAGANEAGKSTLVRAIRAACFERHRSTSVDDLRPYGDGAAAPRIELDFEIGGTPYRLSKSFLQKKRCELIAGTTRLEGVEAEDHLAALLGFQFALKGASREEHWGIPGLLWIEQGAGQEVHGAVRHAADHLRQALDASLGEVAASGGDEVVALLRRQRDELLTGTGKPRSDYQAAITHEEALQAQVQTLQQDLANYRGQVDQLRLLREAHAADAREQPWAALRTQQAAAQQALQAAEALSGERTREAEKLRQAEGMRGLLAQRLQAAAQQLEDLKAREAALAAARTQHEQAVEQEARTVTAASAAETRLQAARSALALARQEDNRAGLQRQLHDASVRAAELATQLQSASAQHERAATLRGETARLALAPADLAALRQQQSRLDALAIEQTAVATRVRFALAPGVRLQLGDAPIEGAGEQLLVRPTELKIEGIGTLHIAPGGSDLAELNQEHAALLGKQQALLQRLGLASAAEAETRERTQARLLAEAEAAEKARKLLAPKGLDALRADLDGARARQAEARTALDRLPPPPAATDDAPADATPNATSNATSNATPDLPAAERAHARAQEDAEHTTRQLQAARQALAASASKRDAAAQERDALHAAVHDETRQAQLAETQRELLQTEARAVALKAALDEVDRRIAQARPDTLRQDVERFRRSADEAERQQQARDRQIVGIESTLAAAGAQGLEEELAQRQGELAQAQRRLAELRRRAEALDFLLQRLDQRRQALTRRLQAPLQQRLDHYLPLLFPTGRLEVDERLVPGALQREGPRGAERGDFDTLSFGAREQMGVISRLAYADLLQEAGRPTLIILDDALVHSDEQRLGAMKRVLFDAAQRHQVLLFTCHPANWRDMGVPLRGL